MNKNYTNRELSELFDKIDTLLQRYFGQKLNFLDRGLTRNCRTFFK